MQPFEWGQFDDRLVSSERAAEIRAALRNLNSVQDPVARWTSVSREVLRPTDPFELHRTLYRDNYRDWDRGEGPEPAVVPTEHILATSNVGRWLRELDLDDYAQFHDFSVGHTEAFLAAALEKLHIGFQTRFDRILDLSEGPEHPVWFAGARMNIVDSVFNGPPESTAIVSRKQDQNGPQVDRWTLETLEALSARVANALIGMGFERGDRVAIAMPMTPNAIAIYLGIVRAGMAVVSIADSFAAEGIAMRLEIADTRAIFTQDVVHHGDKTLQLYRKVCDAGAPRAIVVPADSSLQTELRDTDIGFELFLSDNAEFDSVPCDPADTINILFSSGTTGNPKAIPWNHTTPVRSALDGFVHQDIQPGDVVAWPTNIGWMMGPWLIFATLINKGTIALYEGMPQSRGFGAFVQDAEVNVLGVVPSLVRTWQAGGQMEGLDWSRIKAFSSTGEASNSGEMLYLMSLAGYKPVIEYCGGTETGGAYVSSTLVQPNSPSCFSAKTAAMDFVVLDEAGHETEQGELYLVAPAIGHSTTLLNEDHHAVYFEGCPPGSGGRVLRRHGDEIQVLPGHFFRALGRTDDTMNLGGIKASSVELERTMNQVPGVVETAAIAVSPEGGGSSQLVVYAVTEPGTWSDGRALHAELQSRISKHLNPLFKISDVALRDRLPRTASNKVMRRVLRNEYQNRSGN